jgi:hypothetical protein
MSNIPANATLDVPSKISVIALREALSDVAWRQWKAIGGNTGAAPPARNMVDPEALVCLSLALSVYAIEPRTWGVLCGWVERNSRMLSLQRLRTLAKDYPDSVQRQLGTLALYAAGKDLRWRSLQVADAGEPLSLPPGIIRAVDPPLRTGPATMLRLRLAMGMNVKADALTALLGRGDASATVAELAEATRYTTIGIRQAVDEMSAAGVLRVTPGRPARYYADRQAWTPIIGAVGDARWLLWHDTFLFSMKLHQWWEDVALARGMTPYLRSRDLRELVASVRDATVRLGLPLRDPSAFVGSAYVSVFEEDVVQVAHWLVEHT